MHRYRQFVIAFSLLVPVISAAQAQAVPAAPPASPARIVTVDFVRARPGQLNRLIRYYEENWGRARATVIKQGGISGYQLLVRADSLDDWDVALITEYPDSAAYARREETFAPVLAAKGRILIDGMDRTQLGDFVRPARTMRVAISPPR